MTAQIPSLLSVDEVTSRLDEIVLSSPADSTEVVWLERQTSELGHRLRQRAERSIVQRCVVIRVVEGRRVGTYRTGSSDVGELRAAVRQAIAASRATKAGAGPLLFPGASEPEPPSLEIADPAVQRLSHDEATALLERSCGRNIALLSWLAGIVAVGNSRELRRATEATALDLWVRAGRGVEAGAAASSCRRLDRLCPEEVVTRAENRRGTQGRETIAPGEYRLMLSPEATIAIIEALQAGAFTAYSFRSGQSFLQQHMGVQVFDRLFSLVDDATRLDGLPFPFDLEGRSKQPIELVAKGIAKTPALDLGSAAELALAPTGHGLAGDDAQALNLFLEPGELSQEELLAATDEGVWAGHIEHIECPDPLRVRIRARISGARRIHNGRLTASLPDLLWEDSLLRALSSLDGLGRDPIVRAQRDALLGGTSAPAILLSEAPLAPAGPRGSKLVH